MVHLPGDTPVSQPLWTSWIYAFFYCYYVSGSQMNKDSQFKNLADRPNTGTNSSVPHWLRNSIVYPKCPLKSALLRPCIKKIIFLLQLKLHSLRHFDSNWLKLTGSKICSLGTMLDRLKQTNQTLQGRNSLIFEMMYYWISIWLVKWKRRKKYCCSFVSYLLSESFMPLKDSWVQAEFQSASRMVYAGHFSSDKT